MNINNWLEGIWGEGESVHAHAFKDTLSLAQYSRIQMYCIGREIVQDQYFGTDVKLITFNIVKTNQLNVCKGEVAATGKLCVSKHNSKKRMRHQEITGFHCLEQTPGKHKALTKAVCVHGTKP